MTDLERSHLLRRNLRLLCVFRAIQMSLFPVAIVTLFVRDTLGMTMLEVYLLQGAFALFTALLEFPGGHVADRIGYRRSLIVASLLAIVGWCLYGGASTFLTILISELFLAASLALTSGTDAALMYESLLELDEEPAFGRWFGRARSVGAFAEGSAALLAGVLFVTWPRLPFVVQIAVWVIGVGVAWMLVEPRREQPERLHLFTQAKRLILYTFAHVPKLRACTVTIITLGMATFVPVWLIAPYATDAGLPIAWIGPMWAGANYCVALGNLTSTSALSRFGLITSLALCILGIATGYAGLALTQAVWGFLFYYLMCFARGVNGPILGHEQQRLIPSKDRAALLSVTSVVFRALFALLAPLLGRSVSVAGFHEVLLVTGILFVPVAVASLRWFARAPGPDEALPRA